MKNTLILAIETSCDETSVAVVQNGRHILANEISSQVKIHEQFGGVVPEIASRKHIENIDYVIDGALQKSGTLLQDVDAIAVTCGPGLVGALLVGVSYAKGLAFALNKPLIGVNHIEGHVFANFLEETTFEPPFICLVVSGGHTHLLHVLDYTSFEVLGRTCDDAAGEAFDKIARTLGLPYPGGPEIDKLSKLGNPAAINFPRVMTMEKNFSFSGLKSSVLNYLNSSKQNGHDINEADVAASFQQAVVDVLIAKTIQSCEERNINTVAISGGVACNSALRDQMKQSCEKKNLSLHIPKPIFCTDNAAMIGCRAHYLFQQGNFSDLRLNAYPALRL